MKRLGVLSADDMSDISASRGCCLHDCDLRGGQNEIPIAVCDNGPVSACNGTADLSRVTDLQHRAALAFGAHEVAFPHPAMHLVNHVFAATT